MKSKKTLLIRIIAVAVLIAVAVTMFIIGRGHTVYFDNKDLTADGSEYKSYYQIEVFVDDVSVAKLKSGERGMVSTMGQNFEMVLHITPEKDGKKVGSAVSLKLPDNMDGIILNLPALLSGASEDVYMDEFIPTPTVEDETEDVVISDEFEMPMGDE